MDRTTRHDIKRNELQEWVEGAYGWSSGHVRMLLRWGAVTLAIGLVVVGVVVWRNAQARQANELLGEAVRVMQAPIVAAADAKPNDPREPSFSDEAARRSRARATLERIRRSHPATGAGVASALYLARMAADDGDLQQARTLWSSVARQRRDSMLRAQAWQALYDLDRQEGKLDGLVADLRAQLAGSNRKLPEDVLRWNLAMTLEAQGQLELAREEYQRLVDDHPSSPFVVEARQRIS